MFNHLKQNNTTYYKHWLRAIKLSSALFIHAFFPFIYPGFGLAEMLVKTINKIRVSIPDWEGWKELDRWNKDA